VTEPHVLPCFSQLTANHDEKILLAAFEIQGGRLHMWHAIHGTQHAHSRKQTMIDSLSKHLPVMQQQPSMLALLPRLRQEGSFVSVNRTRRYTTADSHAAKTQHCRRIIAAFPPNKASLAPFDLDAHQRAVFDRVRFVQYISGVIDLPRGTTTDKFAVNTRLLKLTGMS
jgi:hypothetical protein